MNNLTIYYDDLQEGFWFKKLSPEFTTASLQPITGSELTNPYMRSALKYDRADIILVHNNHPILLIERTVEVPSGHNVGQRYARLAGAAEENIPSVYIFPYKAVKHGGKTAGPRYVNLRLFSSLDNLKNVTQSAITTINWPVDKYCEIVRTPSKDIDMIRYLEMFFEYYKVNGMNGIHNYINNSILQTELQDEVINFSKTIKRAEVYNSPPPSVKIISRKDFHKNYGVTLLDSSIEDIIVYDIGAKNMRSDPYTGTAILYDYLYKTKSTDALILNFFELNSDAWFKLSKSNRKDIKLYKHVADAILFKDCLVEKSQL